MLHSLHLRQNLGDLSNQSALNVLIIPKKASDIEGFKEIFKMGLRVSPFINESMNVDILIVQENHPHSRNCCGRSVKERVSFEDEASAIGEIDALTCGKSQKMVVVKHTIQGFNPFWIDISIKNDPIVSWVLDHLPS